MSIFYFNFCNILLILNSNKHHLRTFHSLEGKCRTYTGSQCLFSPLTSILNLNGQDLPILTVFNHFELFYLNGQDLPVLTAFNHFELFYQPDFYLNSHYKDKTKWNENELKIFNCQCLVQKPLAWAWLLSLLLQQLIFHSVKSVFLKHWLLISVCLKFLTEILVLDRCLITWEKSTDKICLFSCACYKKCDNDCLDPRPELTIISNSKTRFN